MPAIPRPPRRPLKMELSPDEQLGRLVRAFERIADGFDNILATFDAIVVERENGERAVRTVSE